MTTLLAQKKHENYLSDAGTNERKPRHLSSVAKNCRKKWKQWKQETSCPKSRAKNHSRPNLQNKLKQLFIGLSNQLTFSTLKIALT